MGGNQTAKRRHTMKKSMIVSARMLQGMTAGKITAYPDGTVKLDGVVTEVNKRFVQAPDIDLEEIKQGHEKLKMECFEHAAKCPDGRSTGTHVHYLICNVADVAKKYSGAVAKSILGNLKTRVFKLEDNEVAEYMATKKGSPFSKRTRKNAKPDCTDIFVSLPKTFSLTMLEDKTNRVSVENPGEVVFAPAGAGMTAGVVSSDIEWYRQHPEYKAIKYDFGGLVDGIAGREMSIKDKELYDAESKRGGVWKITK